MRAASRRNCQSTPRCFLLVLLCQAFTSRRSVAIVSKRLPFRHCRVSALPTTVLGRVPGLQPSHQLPCLGRWERLVERLLAARTQLVTRQDHLLGACVARAQELRQFQGLVHPKPMPSMPPYPLIDEALVGRTRRSSQVLT